MILAILAAFTVSFSPPAPSVGDPVTLEFPAPVVLDASRDYEVVSQEGKRVVVRTFVPRPFALSGVVGGNVRFRKLVIPVQSVLKPNDDLTPAPLAPPKREPWPRAPFVAIGIAALCALLAWALVWRRSAVHAIVAAKPGLSPDERFRRAVLALRASPSHPRRWSMLADETRTYLAATRPHLGSELTTTELVPRLSHDERIVAEILRQGDLEKFSPRREASGNFDVVAEYALHFIPSAGEAAGREAVA